MPSGLDTAYWTVPVIMETKKKLAKALGVL